MTIMVLSAALLVGAADGAISADDPTDLAAGVGFHQDARQQAVPTPVTPPPDKSVVAGLPRAVASRHIGPGKTPRLSPRCGIAAAGWIG